MALGGGCRVVPNLPLYSISRNILKVKCPFRKDGEGIGGEDRSKGPDRSLQESRSGPASTSRLQATPRESLQLQGPRVPGAEVGSQDRGVGLGDLSPFLVSRAQNLLLNIRPKILLPMHRTLKSFPRFTFSMREEFPAFSQPIPRTSYHCSLSSKRPRARPDD